MADPPPNPKTGYITSSDLKAHNKAGDLWISIHGQVYDVSSWAALHPGGTAPLMALAGHDVTDAFLAYHPPSTARLLPPLSANLLLEHYSVSPTSSDYRKLLHNFHKLDLFQTKSHTTCFTFVAMVVLFFLSLLGVFCSDSTWVHLASGGVMGVAWIQSGWLGHDSGHYQIMSSRKTNRFAQVLSGNCLAGISIAWWKWNHNAHHLACNSLDYDPDLQHMPFFVVSSKFFNSLTSRFYDRKLNFDGVSRFLVSYQHWSFYPVMCLARINLFAQSFMLLFSSRKVPDRVQEIFGIGVFWVWYPLLVSCLPNWGERIMFVVASFSVTGIQHVQFCLNHFSAEVYLGPPEGNDWFEKQTAGTLNISCHSWMDWFHGGLQFQIEHHLFPRLPRSQLRKVSPFVRDLCKKHNLPYNVTSFTMANVLTLKTLRNAAIQARDLSNPTPKNLVWEAVNTHG
uniref:Sphingolipid delta-8 desaturase n=1 Tax=Primula farinosa TaxID=133892 RepID=Q84KG9_9ERIC|nr:sphingolipid delta-8 desaturase [Primula farinosa]